MQYPALKPGIQELIKPMNLFRKSLIARIVALLVAISLMALSSITVSVVVAERTQGDAAALNVAGSLRMQTWRIASTLQAYVHSPDELRGDEKQRLLQMIRGFEQRLYNPDLLNAIPFARGDNTRSQHQLIEQIWRRQVLQELNLYTSDQAGEERLTGSLRQLESLVNDIDQMVHLLEKSTEHKVELLKFLHIIGLLITLVILLVAIVDIRNHLIKPLHQLMELAQQATRHNFSVRSGVTGKDELSQLGQAFDQMAEELSVSYSSLEARVRDKTAELERSHKALEILHDTSRSIYEGGGDMCRNALPMLKKLETLLNIGPIKLYLTSDELAASIPVLDTQTPDRPGYCRNLECDICISTEDPEATGRCRSHQQKMHFAVRAGNRKLGSMEVWYPFGRQLSERGRRLLETLADQLATAVYLQNRMAELQQVSLLEERTVIARELHDSLAQSLSYLKIQVARLQKLHETEGVSEAEQVVVDELRTGLNSAYRQLRELLTTFRLKLDKPGLHQAILQTIDEFSAKAGLRIELDYNLPMHLLNPNEEIHVLQIIREALSNTFKHAQATEAQVLIDYATGQVSVRVRDNGVGLKDGRVPDQHYGMVIMRDRSLTLGGNLQIGNYQTGGVELALDFVPAAASRKVSNLNNERSESLVIVRDIK